MTDVADRIIDHVVEDRQTGGGRMVWLARCTVKP